MRESRIPIVAPPNYVQRPIAKEEEPTSRTRVLFLQRIYRRLPSLARDESGLKGRPGLQARHSGRQQQTGFRVLSIPCPGVAIPADADAVGPPEVSSTRPPVTAAETRNQPVI